MMRENALTKFGAYGWNGIFALILCALENERCLDLQFRSKNKNLDTLGYVPNYKVLKQLALKKRFGIFYYPIVLLIFINVFVTAVFDWLSVVLGAIFLSRKSPSSVYAISTVRQNRILIIKALESDSPFSQSDIDFDFMSVMRLGAEVGFLGAIYSIYSQINLWWAIVGRCPGRRFDLLLHSRDAMSLLLLVQFSKRHVEGKFITDDHYQRWAYLLSHVADDFSIVQHGVLDPDISFTYQYGKVKTVYLRSKDEIVNFKKYYLINKSVFFGMSRSLTPNPFSSNCVFIASSFPYVDLEIELAKKIRNDHRVPVVIKFHPAHEYDQRKKNLIELADYICNEDEFPECRVFVSYNSFLENDYIVAGIPTCSIQKLGGVAPTILKIKELVSS